MFRCARRRGRLRKLWPGPRASAIVNLTGFTFQGGPWSLKLKRRGLRRERRISLGWAGTMRSARNRRAPPATRANGQIAGAFAPGRPSRRMIGASASVARSRAIHSVRLCLCLRACGSRAEVFSQIRGSLPFLTVMSFTLSSRQQSPALETAQALRRPTVPTRRVRAGRNREKITVCRSTVIGRERKKKNQRWRETEWTGARLSLITRRFSSLPTSECYCGHDPGGSVQAQAAGDLWCCRGAGRPEHPRSTLASLDGRLHVLAWRTSWNSRSAWLAGAGREWYTIRGK